MKRALAPRLLILSLLGSAPSACGSDAAKGIAGSGGSAGTSGGVAASSTSGGATSGSAGSGGTAGAADGGRFDGGRGGASNVMTGGSAAALGGAAQGGRGGSGGAPAVQGGAPAAQGGAPEGGAAAESGQSGGGSVGASTCDDFAAPMRVGKAEPSGLSSLSGMVASRAQPGVFYAQPDRSGPTFYALDKAGKALAEFSLSGAMTTDWEDVSVGPGPGGKTCLFLADIGDNAARPGAGAGRRQIQVFRVPEPEVSVTQARVTQALTGWEELRFVYPDRPHDAETFMVDPSSGDLLIVSREESGVSTVFRAAGSTPVETETALEAVGQLQFGAAGTQAAHATAGDIAPAGDLVLVRTYEAAFVWRRAAGATWPQVFAAKPRELPVAAEKQCEGATFAADGKSWLSSGESDPTIFEGRANCD